MSIQSEITRISGNVSDALDAIDAKGVTVPAGANSDDLATLIGQIDGGSGEYQEIITASGILKGSGSGNVTAAVAEEDYTAPFWYDLLTGYTGTSETKNGVTFTWNGEKCTIETGSGKSTAQTTSNIFYNMSGLLSGVVPGKTYKARYSSNVSPTKATMKVWFYKNGSYNSGYNVYEDRDDIYVPSDIDGMLIRLQVENNTTINETVSIKLLGPYPNKTIDNEPVEDSNNLITSGAVFDAILGAMGGSY